MLRLLPEPKRAIENNGYTRSFKALSICFENLTEEEKSQYLEIANLRFWNRKDLPINENDTSEDALKVSVIQNLDGIETENNDLFLKQGYYLKIENNAVVLKYKEKAGFVNGITSLKQLLEKDGNGFILPLCEITDWPTIEHRAVAPTFSWYAGYGRIGFDMQLWGYKEWVEYLNICLDNKINQMNMVMYGYWPFNFDEYPETVFKNVPVKISGISR